MREHTLEGTGGLTYAQMGRFQSAAKPDDPAGTSDEAAAAKDESGQPVANGARNTWVTETALTTALNMSYMAERLAVFGLVVGVALLLTGIGLVILAFAVFGRREPATETYGGEDADRGAIGLIRGAREVPDRTELQLPEQKDEGPGNRPLSCRRGTDALASLEPAAARARD